MTHLLFHTGIKSKIKACSRQARKRQILNPLEPADLAGLPNLKSFHARKWPHRSEATSRSCTVDVVNTHPERPAVDKQHTVCRARAGDTHLEAADPVTSSPVHSWAGGLLAVKA
ncbi:hypothetical protein [Streptomyces sp. MMBL 11-3]|uniref:hypothetical protein n=1 Tax=Streptomyces sp. MMBL 11-3 TaxID=3382639 RepID=UPI0039B566C5